MLVVGGYNSSNTSHLAEMPCAEGVPAYHIDDAACILGPDRIRHKPVGQTAEVIQERWLPPGDLIVGLTAGASTPNNKVGEVIEALLRCRGVDPATL
jgi:4-hydroxy-3-methylbut-2-enyl diphosphate reductase